MSKQMTIYAVTGVIFLIAIGVRIAMSRGSRPLNLNMLWVWPLVITGFATYAVVKDGVPDMVKVGEMAIGLVIGAIGGWWRGKSTRIEVDPATHQLTASSPIIAMLVIIAIIGVRTFITTAVQTDPGMAQYKWVADSLLLFGVGFFGVSRIEMFIRGKRLLAEAKAAPATA